MLIASDADGETSSGFIVLAFMDFTYEVCAGGVIPDIPMS